MILSDFHLHSDFSGDCDFKMEEVIEAAIKKGIKYLCFTDHHDIDFPECGIDFTLDIPNYYKHILKMREVYKDQIDILMGIEFGMQTHIYDQLIDITKSYPFDFILASNHLAQGVDPYDPLYFKNISKHEAYMIYFKDILGNVRYFDDFDSYGHLDYVIRYYTGEDRFYEYKDFKVVLDQILTLIIDKKKSIEVNTAGLRKGQGTTNPIRPVFENYYRLGGRMVTLGSDSHDPKDLLADFDQAITMLKEIGFEGHYVYINRQAKFIPFD